MRADERRGRDVAAASGDGLGLVERGPSALLLPVIQRFRESATRERASAPSSPSSRRSATASAVTRALSANRCAMYSSAAYSSNSVARSAAPSRCACRTTAA